MVVFCFLCTLVLRAQKIEYHPQQKLTWDNFKAPKNYKSLSDKSAAYTFCGISYEVTKSGNPKGKAEVKVKAFFVEDKSWKKMPNPGNYLLQHEQLHFDIAEIFARKIRKMVTEKIKTTEDFDRYFKTEYNQLFQEYSDFQTTYDRETQNSINHEKQEFYHQKVAQMLRDLEDYQYHEIFKQ